MPTCDGDMHDEHDHGFGEVDYTLSKTESMTHPTALTSKFSHMSAALDALMKTDSRPVGVGGGLVARRTEDDDIRSKTRPLADIPATAGI
ncbi:MAG: hypothetical protein VX589_17340 [Myxococcota bacterium]|nr:hypothetical protein [Myxococcota bacterium]